ncbi:MAG TPA: hypothetical protein VFZ27_19195 [Terriglobia bacterium]|nr:hypothetical protein [Terriglobia bacterium]
MSLSLRGVGIKVGGATERTMPIQLPVLFFLVIFSQASHAPLRRRIYSAVKIHIPGSTPGTAFPDIDAGAGEV